MIIKILKKIQYNSPVILSFTFISLIVLALTYLSKGKITALLFSVYRCSFKDPFGYIRIFGHVLGHADYYHYLNNFIIILLVGPMLEEKYGSLGLLKMILFTALITGLIHIIFFNTILLGASGIVFMFILLSSYANYEKGKIPLTLILVIIIFLGQEVLNAVTLNDNISQVTHIIGGIIGAVMGYFINDKKQVEN